MTTFVGNNFTATMYKYYEPGVRLIETINGKEVVTDNYSFECKFCKTHNNLKQKINLKNGKVSPHYLLGLGTDDNFIYRLA